MKSIIFMGKKQIFFDVSTKVLFLFNITNLCMYDIIPPVAIDGDLFHPGSSIFDTKKKY